jgi:hypothetical protein
VYPLNPNPNPVFVYIACGALIFVYALNRFNTSASKRYWAGSVGYAVTLLALFAALSFFLQVGFWRTMLLGPVDSLSLPPPLIATLVITALLPTFPVLKEIDGQLLSAFIPAELKRRVPTMTRVESPLAILETALSKRRELTPEEILVADRNIVMYEIDKRVEVLRTRTSFILFVIGLSLVTAAIIVIFAGRLTSIDAAAVSPIDKIKTELADEKKALTTLYQYQGTLNRAGELRQNPNLSSDAQKELKELDRFLDSGTNYDPPIPKNPAALKSMIEKQEGQFEKTSDLFETALKKEVTEEHGYGDWRYIVATAITRIGVVLIIVFLVQILMGLYRYNTRLITYYNSRRDLLSLWEGKAEGLKALDQVLAPPKIDFGKEPKHPLEDIIRAAGAAIQKTAARKGAATTPPAT